MILNLFVYFFFVVDFASLPTSLIFRVIRDHTNDTLASLIIILLHFFFSNFSHFSNANSYKWRHVVFFYERNGQYRVAGLHTCHLAMQTMANTYRKRNITYSSFTTDSAANNITENLRREVGLDQSSKLKI